MSYLLILDIGTTNVKALAFSLNGDLLESLEERIKLKFPEHGWVEGDPRDIINIVQNHISKIEGSLGKPLGIAITNQRSTTILWDKETGEPIYNMITWQDTRTKELVESFSSKFIVRFGNALGKFLKAFSKILPVIKRTKKGAYIITLAHLSFGTTHSSMHIRWIMDNIEDARSAINSGRVLFGTIDSWVAWNLTGKHVTDYTNASATGLFDPFYLKWSDNITKIVGIPRNILPKFVYNDQIIGTVKDYGIPLLTMIADQQASLYMSGVAKGTVKMTNGTGTFIDMNVGERAYAGDIGIYPLVALGTRNKTLYLLEGIINNSGSAIDWLIDIGLMKDYDEIEKAFEKRETGELIFIPALSGLNTPYLRPEIKGAIFGLTRGTDRFDIIRAMVTGIAVRCSEVIEFLEKISGIRIEKVMADGGFSKNDEFLQLVSDLSGKEILRPQFLNGSAYGTFMLARAIHQNNDVIASWSTPRLEKIFKPTRGKDISIKNLWRSYLDILLSIIQ